MTQQFPRRACVFNQSLCVQKPMLVRKLVGRVCEEANEGQLQSHPCDGVAPPAFAKAADFENTLMTRSKQSKRRLRSSTQKSTVSYQESAAESSSEGYQDSDSLHSDALDDPSFQVSKRKRGQAAASVGQTSPRKAPPRKKRKKSESPEAGETEESGSENGRVIVGKVVQAPTTGKGATLPLNQHMPYFSTHHFNSSGGTSLAKHARLFAQADGSTV